MTGLDTRYVRRRVRWWIAFWCFAFLLTHVPLGDVKGPSIQGVDKLIHFSIYFVLTWLGARARSVSVADRSHRLMIRWAFVFAAYGVVDEWLQGFVGRTPDVYDWLADITGIALATGWLAWRIDRPISPRRREPG